MTIRPILDPLYPQTNNKDWSEAVSRPVTVNSSGFVVVSILAERYLLHSSNEIALTSVFLTRVSCAKTADFLRICLRPLSNLSEESENARLETDDQNTSMGGKCRTGK